MMNRLIEEEQRYQKSLVEEAEDNLNSALEKVFDVATAKMLEKSIKDYVDAKIKYLDNDIDDKINQRGMYDPDY